MVTDAGGLKQAGILATEQPRAGGGRRAAHVLGGRAAQRVVAGVHAVERADERQRLGHPEVARFVLKLPGPVGAVTVALSSPIRIVSCPCPVAFSAPKAALT